MYILRYIYNIYISNYNIISLSTIPFLFFEDIWEELTRLSIKKLRHAQSKFHSHPKAPCPKHVSRKYPEKFGGENQAPDARVGISWQASEANW